MGGNTIFTVEDESGGFTIVGGGRGVNVSVGTGEAVTVRVGVKTATVDVAKKAGGVEVIGTVVGCGSNTFT